MGFSRFRSVVHVTIANPSKNIKPIRILSENGIDAEDSTLRRGTSKFYVDLTIVQDTALPHTRPLLFFGLVKTSATSFAKFSLCYFCCRQKSFASLVDKQHLHQSWKGHRWSSSRRKAAGKANIRNEQNSVSCRCKLSVGFVVSLTENCSASTGRQTRMGKPSGQLRLVDSRDLSGIHV